jgi:hypothetical protein
MSFKSLAENFTANNFGILLFYKSSNPQFQSFPSAHTIIFSYRLSLNAVTFPEIFLALSFVFRLKNATYYVPPIIAKI